MPRRRAEVVVLASLVTLCAREAGAAITIHARLGSATDWTSAPNGPGLIPMGGGSDVDAAFVWMHDAIVGDTSPGADVVVLRASGTNGYDSYFMRLARFNSIQTLVLTNPTAAELAMAAAIVAKAEAVWFAGGDQRSYIDWDASSTLMQAVQAVYDRGGVVGGTSAGMAVLGEFAWEGGPDSASAVANPTSTSMNVVPLFKFPLLAGWHTDTHHMNRDRFGRTAALMAKTLKDGKAKGRTFALACSEGSAVVIDKDGLGTYKEQGQNGGPCLVMAGAPATTILAGSPLVYMSVTVTRLDANNQTYDFARRCGTTAMYMVTVDGSKSPIYMPADPYLAAGAPGNPAMCQNNVPAPDAGAPADAAAGATDAGRLATPDARSGGATDAQSNPGPGADASAIPAGTPPPGTAGRDGGATAAAGAGSPGTAAGGTGGPANGGAPPPPAGTADPGTSPGAGKAQGAGADGGGCSCKAGIGSRPDAMLMVTLLLGLPCFGAARDSCRRRPDASGKNLKLEDGEIMDRSPRGRPGCPLRHDTSARRS